ncbi:hypothetical protein [Methylotenera mobilis]|uniref:hypothetical protein n=1 Tax=Methylotenera mobilis TaxID=359408 RepID=UPI000372712B|nr:hypothetical protein [Methylotenera mobilis]
MANEADTNDRRKELDSFNAHQADNRSRATQLVNYAFILAGGTFTTSVTVFSSKPKAEITPAMVAYLHAGWYYLFYATVLFFSMIVLIILRDYYIAEVAWRPQLSGRSPYLKGKFYKLFYFMFESLIIISGIWGAIDLIRGLDRIMMAAMALVG